MLAYHQYIIMIQKIKLVTYFHSHCRIRECDICKQIHLRITADGKMKQCMYTSKDDIDTKKEDFKEKLKEYIVNPAKFYYNQTNGKEKI